MPHPFLPNPAAPAAKPVPDFSDAAKVVKRKPREEEDAKQRNDREGENDPGDSSSMESANSPAAADNPSNKDSQGDRSLLNVLA